MDRDARRFAGSGGGGLFREGGVHVAAAKGGGAFAEFLGVRPAGSFQEGLQVGEGDGVRYPGGDGLVGVVFDDEEGAGFAGVGRSGLRGVRAGARPETPFYFLQESGFILYIVQGVGHEDAVEVIDGEGGSYKVAGQGNEGDDIGCCPGFQGGVKIDGVDGAAGRQEVGEGLGKEARSTAEVGPAGGCSLWPGRSQPREGLPEEGYGFGELHQGRVNG